MHIYLLISVLLINIVSVISPIYAQVGATQAEKAQNLFIKGQELLQEKKYRDSVQYFQRSYQMVPDIKVLITIGSIYKKLGQCVKSYNTWQKAHVLCKKCELKALISKYWVSSTQECSRLVHVHSKPKASLFIDDKNLGDTPISIPLLLGSNYLKLTSNAHKDKRIILNVEAKDKEYTHTYYLEPSTTSDHIGFMSTPPMMNPPAMKTINMGTLDQTSDFNKSLPQTWWEGIKTKKSQTRQTTRKWLWISSSLLMTTGVFFTVLTIQDYNDMKDKVARGIITNQEEVNNGNYRLYHTVALTTGTLGLTALASAGTLWILDQF